MEKTVFITNGNGRFLPDAFRPFVTLRCGFVSRDSHFEAQAMNSSTYQMDVDEHLVNAVRYTEFFAPEWKTETTPLWGIAGRWFLSSGQELTQEEADGLLLGKLIVRYPWVGLPGARIAPIEDPLPMPKLPRVLVTWRGGLASRRALTATEAQALRDAHCREVMGNFVEYL